MTAPSGQAALDNARQVNSYPPGYCLKYVRAEAWRIGSLYASAIDAWHGAIHRHVADRHPPIGAPMFYAGGSYGHIVVCVRTDDGRMRSTDMPSAGEVNEGASEWPEAHWGQDYLGWAEDLNGVDLPIGEEDEMTSEDWKKLRDIVAEEVAANNPAVATKVWDKTQDVTTPTGDKVNKSMRQIARETWQRVAKLGG